MSTEQETLLAGQGDAVSTEQQSKQADVLVIDASVVGTGLEGVDEAEQEGDQHIDPWNVLGGKKGFDYLKLLRQFGTQPITPALIKRIERLTNMRVHLFLRRGIFFSQQDLEKLLDHYEQGKQIFLYTGRGPSSQSMHIGHLVPFFFTEYLQRAFGCILVVQMSDDEKFYFKGENSLDYFTELAYENAKDIVAVGLNPDKTYIFSNREEMGRGNPGLNDNLILMNNFTGINQVRSTFGLNKLSISHDENGLQKVSAAPASVGMMVWPVYQSIPAFSSSFKFIFGDTEALCLVPMGVDQADYFRVARDFSSAVKYLKPVCIHSEFVISLSGRGSKMSSTENIQPIFLTDDTQSIRDKVQRCFSGGGMTKREHIEKGGDLTIDVPYQWLLYFCDDDDLLEHIAKEYSSGRMMTHEIKKIMADCIIDCVTKHQTARNLVTKDVIAHFFNPHRKFDHSRPVRKSLEPLTDDKYEKMGANFDRYFGCVRSDSDNTGKVVASV